MSTNPLLTRRRVMAAKIETVCGVAEALTAAEAAFNVFEPKITQNIEKETRDGQAGFSRLAGVAGARAGEVTFSIECHGSGSIPSPVPAWATTFLPACGLYDDSDVFKLDSRPPGAAGSNTKTLTLGVYADGKLKMIRGAMGNAKFTFTSGKVAMIEFTFTGIWVEPTDVALLAPTYPTVLPPRFAASALDVGGDWTPRVSELTIDLGNDVQLREDSTDVSGYRSATIADRRVIGTLDPEATLIAGVAGHDLYGDWLDSTVTAMSWQVGLGSANGNLIAFALPAIDFLSPNEGDRNGIETDDIEFAAVRSAAAGDDELAITFS